MLRRCAMIGLLLVVAIAACGDESAGMVDAAVSGDGSVGCNFGDGWSTAPAVRGGAIQETAVVALEGKIFVIGGFNASLEIVRSVRIFDTSSCSWSDGPDLPRPMHHANVAVDGGTIYILGAMEANFVAIGDVLAWNPATETTWSPRASMPTGTQRGSAVTGVIDGRIYVAGGLRNSAQATLSAYSIADDTWDTNLPSLPQARDHGCGGVVGGKLYVIGGRDSTITNTSALVFEYTPGGAWVQKAAMPTGRGGVACGIAGDQIIVVGGEGNGAVASGVYKEVELYTVSSNQWSALPEMKTPRHGMGGAVWDGVFYVPGGATRQSFGAVDTHEVFRLNP